MLWIELVLAYANAWGSAVMIYSLLYFLPSLYIVKLINKVSYYAHDNEQSTKQRRKNSRRKTTVRTQTLRRHS